MVLCCGSPWWTTAWPTCTRCLTPRWAATRCLAAGSTACMVARGLGIATASPSGCTTLPVWSSLCPPASTTRACTQRRLSIRASAVAWISLWAISPLSLNISQRPKLTIFTCRGFLGAIREVRIQTGVFVEISVLWSVSNWASVSVCVRGSLLISDRRLTQEQLLFSGGPPEYWSALRPDRGRLNSLVMKQKGHQVSSAYLRQNSSKKLALIKCGTNLAYFRTAPVLAPPLGRKASIRCQFNSSWTRSNLT